MTEEISNALETIVNEGLILYPTDTVWGIGCDATNVEAVQKVFRLKKREESKSLVILVSSVSMLRDYIDRIPDEVLNLLHQANQPTTIIYENPKGLAQNTIAQDNTIAIRIPNHNYCIALIEEFGKPIVSTSANISGDPTPKSFSEVTQPILDGVDYVVNLEREKITEKSSTILKISGDDIQVIRA